jgi:DNA mismatch repair protein MutS
MEDPALAKGLVDRDIIRIITPATVVESSMLEEGSNNYYASLCQTAEGIGVALVDISTGEACATFCDGEDARDKAFNELGRFEPKELIVDEDLAQGKGFALDVQVRLRCPVNVGRRELYGAEAAAAALAAQFPEQDLSQLPMPTRLALGALVQTLRGLQKGELRHVNHVEYYLSGRYLELDLTARRNLELTQTLRGKDKKGSLLWVMDKTKTSMGSRMLRAWMEKPLRNPNEIRQRLEAVAELKAATLPRQELLLTLKTVTDLERVTARIVTGAANARDLLQLSQGSAPVLPGNLAPKQLTLNFFSAIALPGVVPGYGGGAACVVQHAQLLQPLGGGLTVLRTFALLLQTLHQLAPGDQLLADQMGGPVLGRGETCPFSQSLVFNGGKLLPSVKLVKEHLVFCELDQLCVLKKDQNPAFYVLGRL